MTISNNAKDYIARHFGSGNCFASSGISYTDPNGGAQTGSTQDVVATLKLDAGGHARGPNNETFYDITDFQTIDHSAITWIGNHQSGSSRYCVSGGGGGGGPPGSKPTTPPMEVVIAEGVQCDPGAPTVTLDVTEARPYFKASPLLYVGVMGIDVTNINTGNDCFAYFVWEMRMWPGEAGETCPTTDPLVQEISRFLATKSDYKTISPQLLGTGEKAMVGGSFEIPAGTHGTYTLCLSLWGNFDKQALLDELAAAGYPEKIRWL